MTATNPVPWPPRWRPPKVGFGVSFALFFAACTALCVAVGVSGFTIALLWTPLFAGFALSFVAMLVGVRSRSARSVRVGPQPDGLAALTFPYSLRLTVAVFLVLVGLAAGGLTFLAVELASALDGDALGWAGVAVFALIDAFGLVCLLGVARRHLVRGAVYLSPIGIVHRTWGADTAIGWDEVLDVAAEERATPTGYGNAPPSPVIRLFPYAGAHAAYTPRSLLWRPLRRRSLPVVPLISGTVLGVDPALAYHTLRFYHRHPDARAELGTDAAVRRVRAGQVL